MDLSKNIQFWAENGVFSSPQPNLGYSDGNFVVGKCSSDLLPKIINLTQLDYPLEEAKRIALRKFQDQFSLYPKYDDFRARAGICV